MGPEIEGRGSNTSHSRSPQRTLNILRVHQILRVKQVILNISAVLSHESNLLLSQDESKRMIFLWLLASHLLLHLHDHS